MAKSLKKNGKGSLKTGWLIRIVFSKPLAFWPEIAVRPSPLNGQVDIKGADRRLYSFEQ